MATEMVAPASTGVWRHLRADPYLIGLSAVRRHEAQFSPLWLRQALTKKAVCIAWWFSVWIRPGRCLGRIDDGYVMSVLA